MLIVLKKEEEGQFKPVQTNGSHEPQLWRVNHEIL
jgi:hypothetical protein